MMAGAAESEVPLSDDELILSDEDGGRDPPGGPGGPTVVSRDSQWRFYNIIILGLSFMLLFTAFQTGSMVETLVLDGARNESNGTFTGDGYVSLAIIYGSMAVSNWIAPSIVAVLGAKWSMISGATLYTLFIASFLKPTSWMLYTASALVGLGAAVLWTAQGNCLTANSNADNIGRNGGIFWAMFQSSVLIGNIYVYFNFTGITLIQAATRNPMFIILTVLSAVGTITFVALRRVQPADISDAEEINPTTRGPLEAFKSSIRILFTKPMLLLLASFAYTGFEQSFWAAVYGTSVGRTMSFGTSAKQLTGLCGVFIGVGEILGAGSLGLLGQRSASKRPGRDTIILFGFIVHVVSFYFTFLNLPGESPLRETDALPFLTPNKYLAVVCAFCFGLGDSCFNTQMFPIIGALFPSDTSSAFALFKFIQSLASTATFLYSGHLELQWQLLILVVFATVATLLLLIVDVWAREANERVANCGLSSDDLLVNPGEREAMERRERAPLLDDSSPSS